MGHRSRMAATILLALALAPVAAAAQDAGRSRVGREAAAQAARADALFKAGKYEAALALYRAEAGSRKALGDARYEAYARRGAGCCLEGLGDLEGAIDAYKAARAIDTGGDDPGFAGYDGLLIARVQLRLDRPAEAVATLAEALPRLRQAADRDHECDARLALVEARLALGDPEQAAPDAARALALALALDDPARAADARLALGLVDLATGRLGPAWMRLQDARDGFRDQARDADLAAATANLADVIYRLGRPGEAARLFEESAALHAKVGDGPAEAADRLDLAAVRLDLGDPAAAAREAARARDGFLAADDEARAVAAMVVLARVQSLGKEGEALATSAATVRDALARSARAHRDRPDERARLLLLSADLESRLGRRPEAASRLDEAGRLAEKAGDPLLRQAVADLRKRLGP